MLSLEIHLGVTDSPQIPFPTDYVTLPVSASHRRFGSLPLVAEKGHSRHNYDNLPGTAFQTCSSNFTPMRAGYVGWAYNTSYPNTILVAVRQRYGWSVVELFSVPWRVRGGRSAHVPSTHD